MATTKGRSLRLGVAAAAVALTVAGFGVLLLRGEALTYLLGGLSAVTAGFMLAAAPKFWRGSDSELSSKTRWAFQLHAFRTGVVGVSALAFLLMSLEIHGGFFFLVLAFSLPYLFFGIPGTAGLIRVLLKDQPDAARFRKNSAVLASRLITGFAWAASAVVIGLGVAVFQPWPFSLYEGPDTNWARAGFESTFGFTPPRTVDRLFYRNVSFWQTRESYVKFSYSDPAVVQRILDSMQVEPEPEPRTYQEIRSHFPSWWLKEAMEVEGADLQFHESPSARAVRESVWIDRETRTFYYMFLD